MYVYYTNGSKKREYSVDEVLKIDFRPGTDTVVGADKDKKLRIMKSGSTTSKSVSPSQ